MSGWGNLIPILGGVLQNQAQGSTLGNLINFGYGVLNQVDADKQATNSANAYYGALAQNQNLTRMAGEIAAQRAVWERALKERGMQRTDELGATLRAAQQGMGAMPQFDQGTIDRDYQTTKSTMMNDFNDMLRLVESEGRAAQIDRLGGAESMAADDSRKYALYKKFTPMLQQVDDAAYDTALNREKNRLGVISGSRSATLGEIKGIFDAEINPTISMMQGNDVSNLINTNTNGMNSAAQIMKDAGQGAADNGKFIQDNLSALLNAVFNKRKNSSTNGTIYELPPTDYISSRDI